MDPLALCADYSTFRFIIRGSLCGSGWVRRFCFPALANVLAEVAEEYEEGYWRAFPPEDYNWDLLRRGYTFAAFVDLFSTVDLSNGGRVLSFLGFLSFILRYWPSDSVVPAADRLDFICIPAWTKMQLWSQSLRFMEELESAMAARREGMGSDPAPAPAEEPTQPVRLRAITRSTQTDLDHQD
ncbi:small T-antigen [bat adenovirus 3]|uniref:E1B protein, small T-antigen n=1 Tax=bat adenovirus 3 TaxID=2758098 RepID=D3X7A9_9ADEN|nr:small T-antigen [bat adenovirus 3]ADD17098.1 small T-antigen [bat adenovirus 3]